MFIKFKSEVEEYLKSKEEISTFRVSQQGRIFKVSLILKVEHWVIHKLTEELEFYKPIYQSFLNNKPDYKSDIKINIYCSKK